MLIRKLRSSLYKNIILRIVFSVLIGLLFFYLTSTGGTVYLENRRVEYLDEHNNDLDNFTTDFQQNIINNSLRIEDFTGVNSIENGFFDIELHSDQTIIETNSSEYGIIREINFDNSIAYLSINPKGYSDDLLIVSIISIVLSIIVFFACITVLLSPIVKYIEDIKRSVDLISTDNLSQKAPVRGENELSLLAEGINSMGEKLMTNIERERSFNLKQRQLVTNLSHDIRTPLTSILGYIDLSKKKADKNSEIYKYVDIAEKNAVKLKEHIDELFFYSQATSNDLKVKKTKVNLYRILNQVIELYNLHVESLFEDETIQICVDPQYYYRIISNLLSNCEKHAVKDSIVHISVNLIDKYVVVSISNTTDIELSDELLHLKTRLYFSNNSRKTNSTGLGLAICVELCELMDGKLELEYDNSIFTAKVFMPID